MQELIDQIKDDYQIGIFCDNVDCDYQDETVTNGELHSLLNAPCPKCGDNLYTEQDFHNHNKLVAAIQRLEGKSEAEMLEMLVGMGFDVNDMKAKFLGTINNKHEKMELE